MKNVKKITALEEKIAATGIYDSIELLKHNLFACQQSTNFGKKDYIIYRESERLQHHLDELKGQLNDLIETSKERGNR